ncbi:MAG: orotidine-5'-phosphate decarboxylase [Gammaproteobacteria bacterium]|nr:orotidine-5'-phosphate decarboxylase [Gammaproteobacteria bacterium]
MSHSKVIVALDFPGEKKAMQLVEKLDPELCRLKVGKELFTRCGPSLVKKLVASGFDVFLDLKFHDIPNTVAKACESAAELGVWMLNVHSMGGAAMMAAARHVLNYDDAPLLIAVTLLTSSGEKELGALGINETPADFVKRLAMMAKQAGLDGVVCSAQEAAMLKQQCGSDFLLVTPGIRPENASVDDQNRIMTPKRAIENGSNYLVIGRPVTQSDDPVRVLTAINADIGFAS